MPYHNPKHPLWSFLRLVVLMLALTITLWLNAQHFDETELRTIIWMFIGAAGIEGGVQALQQVIKKE